MYVVLNAFETGQFPGVGIFFKSDTYSHYLD